MSKSCPRFDVLYCLLFVSGKSAASALKNGKRIGFGPRTLVFERVLTLEISKASLFSSNLPSLWAVSVAAGRVDSGCSRVNAVLQRPMCGGLMATYGSG